MSVSLWLVLALACLSISLTPGAGAVNSMSLGLSVGYKKTVFSILGQQVALIMQILIVALGVGAIISSSEIMFNIIRYLGAAYLVYLGVRKFMESPHIFEQQRTDPARSKALPLFMRGFMVNILNPKAIVFVLAFIPQFVHPEHDLVPQYLLIIATMISIDIAVMSGFAVLALQAVKYLTSTSSVRTMNRIFGALFVAAGLILALVHH